MSRYAARITRCGCMMRIVRKGLVTIDPCTERCESMLDRDPPGGWGERAHRIPARLPHVVHILEPA